MAEQEPSPWAKYAATPKPDAGEEYRLDQTVDAEKFKLKARTRAQREAEEEEVRLRRVQAVAAHDILPQDTEWLWEDRVPCGEVTLIGGRGGVGKSTLLAWFVAKITKGTLKGNFYGVPRDVLYVANEDSFSRTVVPRFMAAGADLSRVSLIRMENTLTGKLGSLNLPLDCDALKEEIQGRDAAAVFLDPMSSNLKGVRNRNDATQVREALEEVRQMCEDTSCAALALAHIRKMTSTNFMDSIAGSAEYGNVVRAAMGVIADPQEEGAYILSQEKNNLGRLDIPSWRYKIESRVCTYYKTGQQLSKPLGKVKMIDQTNVKVTDILEDMAIGGRIGEAMDWLRYRLARGPANSSDLAKEAQKEGIAKATLYRAADRLNVHKSARTGFQGHTEWSLNPFASQ